jgi:hypothetical protein
MIPGLLAVDNDAHCHSVFPKEPYIVPCELICFNCKVRMASSPPVCVHPPKKANLSPCLEAKRGFQFQPLQIIVKVQTHLRQCTYNFRSSV